MGVLQAVFFSRSRIFISLEEGKFVFQKSLSETPFKPDRVSFCTPNFHLAITACGGLEVPSCLAITVFEGLQVDVPLMEESVKMGLDALFKAVAVFKGVSQSRFQAVGAPLPVSCRMGAH